MATPLFQIATPLKPSDVAALKPALDNLQGNLLKSHGRDRVAHVFITFTGTLESARKFMSAMSIHATSANEQQKQTDRHTANPKKNETFTQVLISAQGYAFLNVDTSAFDPSFRLGMKQARTKLSDPPVGAWEGPFKRDIHALIVLADDRKDALEDRVDEIRGALDDIAEVHVEIGLAVKNTDGRVIEHFGYIDGRSQPLFFETDLQKEPTTAKWDPSAGPRLILVKDPQGKSDDDCGTYYVFRKLEQNVRGFKQREQDLADALHLTGDARELAGALVVGRFENGTPVVLHNAAVASASMGAGAGGGTSSAPLPPVENDFAYPVDDAPGNKCPFIGHIRKTNPRGDTAAFANLDEEKAHRIARRGITFGEPKGPGEDISKLPTHGVGLLFQCCNRDLSQQFEFLQQTWADNVNFLPLGNGIDPVMGQSTGAFPNQHWPASYGSSARVEFGFNNFVTMKGGEYFFCPSITFLKSLA